MGMIALGRSLGRRGVDRRWRCSGTGHRGHAGWGSMDGSRFERNVKWKEIEAEARAVVVKILMFASSASKLLGERAADLAFFLSQSATSSSCLVDQVNIKHSRV